MKKLFSFLCLLMLGAGMMVQAQVLDAVNDSPEGETIPEKFNLVSGRNNAPQLYKNSGEFSSAPSVTNGNA